MEDFGQKYDMRVGYNSRSGRVEVTLWAFRDKGFKCIRTIRGREAEQLQNDFHLCCPMDEAEFIDTICERYDCFATKSPPSEEVAVALPLVEYSYMLYADPIHGNEIMFLKRVDFGDMQLIKRLSGRDYVRLAANIKVSDWTKDQEVDYLKRLAYDYDLDNEKAKAT